MLSGTHSGVRLVHECLGAAWLAYPAFAQQTTVVLQQGSILAWSQKDVSVSNLTGVSSGLSKKVARSEASLAENVP